MTREQVHDYLVNQIKSALVKFLKQETCPIAAMLSGMSLVAEFMAKNDGNQYIRAQNIVTAIHAVAKEIGDFETAKLGD